MSFKKFVIKLSDYVPWAEEIIFWSSLDSGLKKIKIQKRVAKSSLDKIYF